MDGRATTVAARPELWDLANELVEARWPRFMLQDEVALRHWQRVRTDFAGYQAVLHDEAGRPVAAGFSIPFVWDGTAPGLPEGWDAVLQQAIADHDRGRAPNALSALSITVAGHGRGQRLGARMLDTFRELARANGLGALVAPVRPTLKHAYPLTPMNRYAAWTRPDGSPFDPWVREHWRLGARPIAVCPRSMVITGSVGNWESWTDMRFPETGRYVVPGALVPVEIDRERDQGRYMEPNLWMRHVLS